jgi:hypothetical protein
LENEEFARAEQLARECLAGHEELMEDTWFEFDCRSMLGACLLGQKQYTAAEPFLLSGYEGMKEREAAIPLWGRPRLRAALQRLVKFCEETSRDSQAAEWREKLAAFAKTGSLQAFGIPLRASQTPPNLIDLSAFYNAGFKGNGLEGGGDNDFSELPVGIQELAGTRFDVRGLIQLCGNKADPSRYPDRITGLPAPGKCHRVHLLHGLMWVSGSTNAVARYVFHYADGTTSERPIVLRKDVLNWWTPPPEPADDGPIVAWSGQNPATRRRKDGQTIQIYKTTWKNPTPDVEITRIDFISTKRGGDPFLFAITVE